MDPNTARKIIASLEVHPGDAVLEIGPGRGALTGLMHNDGLRVMAMEKDLHLARKVKKEWPGVMVFAMDALKYNWEKLDRTGERKVIGNLPYNVASPIIWELVSRAPAKTGAVFMVQKEVAQRLVASPGGKIYGALTVWVQTFADVQLLFTVKPNVFRPRPRVDSAVVKLAVRAAQLPRDMHMHLGRTIKRFFSQRRKQLGTILKSIPVEGGHNMLETLEIDHRLRPEQLAVDDFRRIAARIGPGIIP